MNKRVIALWFVCCLLIFGAKEQKASDTRKIENLVLKTDAPITISVGSENEITLVNSAEFVTSLKNEIKNVVSSVNEQIKYVTQGFKDSAQSVRGKVSLLKKVLWGNKFKVAVTGATGVYLYFLYRAIRVNQFLKQENLWSSWRKGCSMKELLAVPQKELAKELICKIQSSYISEGEPSSSMTSFMSFMQAIDEEAKQLKACLRFCFCTGKFKAGAKKAKALPLKLIGFIPYCGWVGKLAGWNLIPTGWSLMPACIETKEQIEERIERLVYFKNLFSTWLAEYKFKKMENEVATPALSEQAA